MTNQSLPEPPKLTPEDIEAFRKAYELYRTLANLEAPAPPSEPSEMPPAAKELKQLSLF